MCGLANRMQLKHVTYLSVFRVEEFPDVPHFASKLAVENALREFGLPFTTLRPSYYMQNDLSLERLLTGPGVYPIPIGTAGISAVDIRDIGRGGRDHAYRKRPRRENSRPGWPNARRWTWCCGFVEQTAWEKRCTAGTTLTAGSRRRVRTSLPGWPSTFARCTKRISIRGFASTASQVSRLTELLGHPPRSYAEFAADAALRWRAAA